MNGKGQNVKPNMIKAGTHVVFHVDVPILGEIDGKLYIVASRTTLAEAKQLRDDIDASIRALETSDQDDVWVLDVGGKT